MKRLREVFDFYLYGNVHIALCAVALVLVTRSFFHYHLRSELFVFVFCGTFFLYNLQRLPAAFANVRIESKFRRHRWNTDNRVLLAVVSVLAAIAAGLSFLKLYHRSQLVALLPALLSLAYAFPFVRWKGKWRQLRDIEVLKIFVVAIVWGMICVLLPAAAADTNGVNWFTLPVFFWFIACSLLIFSLTVPFDIRDLYYDGEQLKTIPSVLGVKRAIGIAIGSLLLSDVLVFFATVMNNSGGMPAFAAFFLWTVIAGIVIAKSSPERHEYYFSFLVDGTILLLGIMVLLAGCIQSS